MALAKALKVVMMLMLRLLQILLMERRSVVTVLGQVGLIEEEDLTGRLVASYVKFQMNLCQSVLALTVFSGFTRSV